MKANVWQRRSQAQSQGNSEADGENDPNAEEAAILLERMDTVQALLNSLAGRMDPLSVDTTKSLQAELSALRIKKTKLKPLRAQLFYKLW